MSVRRCWPVLDSPTMSPPLDVVTLAAAIDAGQSFGYRFFWSHRARKDGKLSDACFSQWWPARFVIDDATYTSTEQWMRDTHSSRAPSYPAIAPFP